MNTLPENIIEWTKELNIMFGNESFNTSNKTLFTRLRVKRNMGNFKLISCETNVKKPNMLGRFFERQKDRRLSWYCYNEYKTRYVNNGFSCEEMVKYILRRNSQCIDDNYALDFDKLTNLDYSKWLKMFDTKLFKSAQKFIKNGIFYDNQYMKYLRSKIYD